MQVVLKKTAQFFAAAPAQLGNVECLALPNAGCSATAESPRRRTASWPVKKNFAWKRKNRGMKDEGANEKNKETFPSKRGTIKTSVSLFYGRRDDERKPTPAHAKRELTQKPRARVTRAHQYLLFFAFTPSPVRISFTHNPIRGEDFPSKKVHLRHRASQALLRMLQKRRYCTNDGEHKGERNGEGKRQNPSP